MRFVTLVLGILIATSVALPLRRLQRSEPNMLSADGNLYLEMSYNITRHGIIHFSPEFSPEHGRILPPGWPIVLAVGPTVGLTAYDWGRMLLPALAGIQAALCFLVLRKLGTASLAAGLGAVAVVILLSGSELTYVHTEPFFCTLILGILLFAVAREIPTHTVNAATFLLAGLALAAVFVRPAGLALFPALLVVDLIRGRAGWTSARAWKLLGFWSVSGVLALVAYVGYIRSELVAGGVPDDVLVYAHSRMIDGSPQFSRILLALVRDIYPYMDKTPRSVLDLAALDWPGYRATAWKAVCTFYQGPRGILFLLSAAALAYHLFRWITTTARDSTDKVQMGLAALHGFGLTTFILNSGLAAYAGVHPLYIDRIARPSVLLLLLAITASFLMIVSALLAKLEKSSWLRETLGIVAVSLALVAYPSVSKKWYQSFTDTLHGHVDLPPVLNLIKNAVSPLELVATPHGYGSSEFVVAAGRFQTFIPDDFETSPDEAWHKSVNFILWPMPFKGGKPPQVRGAILKELGRYEWANIGQVLYRIELEPATAGK